MKKKVSLLAVLFLCPLFLFAKTITIYHTSDTHGFFYPKNGQGGFAALASVIKQGPQNYLLLDSGDFTNGTAETRSSKGIKAVQLMNALHYDAATVGNHEFDFKDKQVPVLFETANFPILAANFFLKGTQNYPDHVQPYNVFDVDGVKVAVIGLANTKPTKPTSAYEFSEDPLETLNEMLSNVQAQTPQVVVVLVHDALQDTKHGTKPYISNIATKLGGRVHAVLGGHAHQTLENKHINSVLFSECGIATQYVSKISVEVSDDTGEVTATSSKLIPLIVDQVGEDEEIKALAESLREPGIDEPLGTAAETFYKFPQEEGQLDSSLNNWVADLMLAAGNADVAMHNNGGSRADLLQGTVTERDLLEVFPYDNDVVVMPVTGAFLAEAVKKTFGLFTYAGLELTYIQNADGTREVGTIKVNGKRLNPSKVYTLVTNSFVAEGVENDPERGEFVKIPDEQKTTVKAGDGSVKTVRGIIKEDLLNNSPLVPPSTGRMKQMDPHRTKKISRVLQLRLAAN